MGYIGTKPADAALTSSDLEDGIVTAAKIATDAVETAKVKDVNVTAGKLAATQDLSTKTITLPATVAGLGTGIDVTSQITGTVPTANLGSGTASSSTYLAGDQTYKSITAVDIAWQAVTTGTTLTAVAGRGYPINTTSNVCTVTLPASASVGDQIIFTDYARTWNTYAVTLDQGSLKYQGYDDPNPVYDTNGESVHIVYMDATKGWVPIYDGAVTFETPQTIDHEYLIVGGGGSGGRDSIISGYGSAGGAGGYRTNYGGTAVGLTPGDTYTITVGTGGAGYGTSAAPGNSGIDSSIAGTGLSGASYTAAGGGFGNGGTSSPLVDGGDGGSGGGANQPPNGGAVGSGNEGGDAGSPSIPEGFDGSALSTADYRGGAGGGASEAGGTDANGHGGDGITNSITGSAVAYAGGGSGCCSASESAIAGGDGGGGTGAKYGATSGTSGTDGLGGGGGGIANSGGTVQTTGGDGIVILRVATADKGTPSGEDSSVVNGLDTVITWLATGSYVA